MTGEGKLCVVHISERLAKELDAHKGDLLYISDKRWWLGGLRSTHAVVGKVEEGLEQASIVMGPETYASLIVESRSEQEVAVDRLY